MDDFIKRLMGHLEGKKAREDDDDSVFLADCTDEEYKDFLDQENKCNDLKRNLDKILDDYKNSSLELESIRQKIWRRVEKRLGVGRETSLTLNKVERAYFTKKKEPQSEDKPMTVLKNAMPTNEEKH